MTAISGLVTWPFQGNSFGTSGDSVDTQNVHLSSKESFLKYLNAHQVVKYDLLQMTAYSNDLYKIGIENVLFYAQIIDGMATAATRNVHNLTLAGGFWSNVDVIDGLFKAVVSLSVVKALGTVFYFRGRHLVDTELYLFVAHSRIANNSFVEYELSQDIVSTFEVSFNRIQSLASATESVLAVSTALGPE